MSTGLTASHLGKTLQEIQPHMMQMVSFKALSGHTKLFLQTVGFLYSFTYLVCIIVRWHILL